jgi:hypothetical protein
MKFNTLCCLIASIAFLAETVYLVSTIVATILQFIRWIAERLETLKHSLERFSVSECACNTNSELTLHEDNPMMWSATSPPGEVCTTTKYFDSEVFTSIQATPAPLGAISPAEDIASLDVLPSLGGSQPLMLPEGSPLGDADAAIEESPLGDTSTPGGSQPLMLPASLPLGESRTVRKASPLGQAFLSKADRNQTYLQSLRVAGLQELIKKEKKIAKFGTFPKVPTKANKATLVAALLTYYNSLA